MQEFTTPDLSIAAYLIARGFKLLGLVPQHKRYGFRIADPQQSAADEAFRFLQNDPIPAKSYWDAAQGLRTLLFQTRAAKGGAQ